MYESITGDRRHPIKITMHNYFSAPPLRRLPKPFRLCNSSVSTDPACGGQVKGDFANDAAHRLWTFPSSLCTTPHSSSFSSSSFFPVPYPPTHPPTSPPSPCLPYTHIHTYTQSRMHRDCSNSSSTARWRSPLRV